MRNFSKIERLCPQPGLVSGVATAFPFLSAADGAGVRVGVSEFSPGEVAIDLGFDEGIFVLDGEMEIEGDGDKHVLGVGEFLWMPGGREIIYRARTPARILYVIPSMC